MEDCGQLRIGIVACETFKREIDLLTDGDSDIVFREYLEFRLHEYPEDLKKAVVDKVNSLAGKVDAVFLGYGICQSLKGITERIRVPTVMMEEDDCVGVLLTSNEYAKERKICAGTFFATPAFAEMGVEWFEKEMRKKMPNYEELGIDAMWFMERLFEGYSRTLFIDTGVGDVERYEALSKKFAEQLHLRHESRKGTLSILSAGLARTKALACTSIFPA